MIGHRECFHEAARLVREEAEERGERTPVADAMALLAVDIERHARELPSSDMGKELAQAFRHVEERLLSIFDAAVMNPTLAADGKTLRALVKSAVAQVAREIHRGDHRL